MKLTRVVLNDGNFETLGKLASSIAEAVLSGKQQSATEKTRRHYK